ncbi:aspartic proteinase nepenthesin-1-like [Lolium perenne]|uniref:aspartic proteinase nepenthesin-1-like n=1 Tax=Lolium perenne TaxID=4522 RepID=UPI0021F60F77|nr:aspartic proteinase nepenthesin-1-like [Lolium perenne]
MQEEESHRKHREIVKAGVGENEPSTGSDSFNKISCIEKSCRDFIRGPDNICRSAGDRCEYTESFGTTPFPDMLFGCGGDIRLPGLAVAGASGFAGFSRSPLSLVSQLDISRFSYFIDNSGDGSFLKWSIGQAVDTAMAKGSRITPLLVPNRKEPLELLTDIPAGTFDVGADGSGGVFLSTTLPVTYLEQAAYNVLRRELVSGIKAQVVAPAFAADDLTRLCFLTQDFDKAKIPTISLVFDGSDAAMELSVENYFFKLADGTTCLTIQPSRGGSVLGSLLQAGRAMTYDIYAAGGGQLTFEMATAGAPAQVQVSLMTIIATLLVAWVLGDQSI